MKEQLIFNQTAEKEATLRSIKYTDVLIDVDSCLTSVEGIDELARIRNAGPEIAELTRLAMDGEVPIEDVFKKRLDAINPRMEDLYHVGGLYLATLTKNSTRTIELLKESGVNVHLLSGGYDIPVRAAARFLGIPYENLYTNVLLFENNRDYLGFDESIPLWQKNGKRKVVQALKAAGKLGNKVAIVGDGVSELETLGETDFFIGFGAHVRRQAVEEGADVFLTNPNFSALLPLLLDQDSIQEIAERSDKDRIFILKAHLQLITERFNPRAELLKAEIFNHALSL